MKTIRRQKITRLQNHDFNLRILLTRFEKQFAPTILKDFSTNTTVIMSATATATTSATFIFNFG